MQRICLIAHFAWGALSGACGNGHGGHVGGVEWQTSLTARWLAARGHDVTLVTWDEGQPDGVEVDGVRVLKVCARSDGVRGLRFFHPRWTSLVRALGRADADVYYQNCGEVVTGQVAFWCRSHDRGFVYSVASDPDCDARLPLMSRRRERVLYRYGLRHADRVIVQTRTQQRMLEAGFAVPSVVIPMPCPGPGEADYRPPSPPDGRSARAVWIGRVVEPKRPDRLLEVARALPRWRFDLVGPAGADPFPARVLAEARALPNVTAWGALPRERLPSFFEGAACLLSTSDSEGFPNTFLEAWSRGVPVVSTFDPDGVIAGRGLGLAAPPEPAAIAAALEHLAGARPTWVEMSDAGRRYWFENHRPDVVLPRFEAVFREAARRPAEVAGGVP